MTLLIVAALLGWWLGSSLHRTSQHHLAVRQAAKPGRVQVRPQARVPLGPRVPPLSLDGGPSLSAALVEGILAAYGSPLHGHGKDLVALSERYRVDDAVALAFFVMESRAGTQGEATITHSFGNLRPMPNEPAYDGYRSYRTWMEGADEWFKVVRSLYIDQLDLHTVDSVVPVYAPASDTNDPVAMAAGIHQLVRCWRGTPAACPDDPAEVRALVASEAGRL